MISAVGYDADTKELQVRFSNGQTYSYSDVDEADGEGLLHASSPGSFFHANIKPAYDGTLV